MSLSPIYCSVYRSYLYNISLLICKMEGSSLLKKFLRVLTEIIQIECLAKSSYPIKTNSIISFLL